MPGYYFSQETIQLLNAPNFSETEITLFGLEPESKELTVDELRNIAQTLLEIFKKNSSITSITIDTEEPDIIKTYLMAIHENLSNFGNACKINKLKIAAPLTLKILETVFDKEISKSDTSSLPECITDLTVLLNDIALVNKFINEIKHTRIDILRLDKPAGFIVEELTALTAPYKKLRLDLGERNQISLYNGYTLRDNLLQPPARRIDKIINVDAGPTVSFLRDTLDEISKSDNALFPIPNLKTQLERLTTNQRADFFSDLSESLSSSNITSLELAEGTSDFFENVFQLVKNNPEITQLNINDLSVIDLGTTHRWPLENIIELTLSLKKDEDKLKLKAMVNSKIKILELSSEVSLSEDLFASATNLFQVRLHALNELAASTLALPASVEMVSIFPMSTDVLHALAERIRHQPSLQNKKYAFLMLNSENLELLSSPLFLKQLQQMHSKLTVELDEVKKSKQSLEENIKALNEENSVLDEENEKFASTVKRLTEERDQKQSQLENLHAENAKLHESYEKMEGEFVKSRSEIDESQKQSEGILSVLENNLKESQELNSKLQLRVKELEDAYVHLDKEIAIYFTEKQQAAKEKDEKQLELDKLHDEVKDLLIKNQKTEAELIHLQHEQQPAHDLNDQLQKRVKNLEEEVDEHEQANVSLRGRIGKLEGENERLNEENNNLSAQVKKLTSERDAKQSDLDALHPELGRLEALNQAGSENLTNAKNEIERLNGIIFKMENESRKNNAERESLKTNLNYQLGLKGNHEEEKKALNEEIDHHKAANERLGKEIAALGSKVKSIESGGGSLKNEVAELNKKLLSIHEEEKSQLRSEIDKYAALLAQEDQNKKTQQEALLKLQLESNKHQLELQNIKAEKEKSQKDLQSAQEILEELEGTVETLKQNEHKLIVANSIAERELIVSQAPHSDVTHLSETLLTLQQEFNDLKEKHAKTLSEMTGFREQIKEKDEWITNFQENLSSSHGSQLEQLVAENYKKFIHHIDAMLEKYGFCTFTEFCNFVEKGHTNGRKLQFSEVPGEDDNILYCNPIHLQLTNRHGSTALHMACDIGNTTLAKLFFEKGANPNCQNYHGHTPLHIAVLRGSEVLVRLFTDVKFINKLNANLPDFHGKTPFYTVINTWNLDIINIFLDKAKDLNLQMNQEDKQGNHPFVLAVEKSVGKTPAEQQELIFPLLRRLIQAGASINAKTKKGESGLFVAVNAADVSLTNYLLSLNAQPSEEIFRSAADKFNASGGKDAKYISILKDLKTRFPIDFPIDEDNNSYLYKSIKEGNLDLVEAWLKLGASPKVVNKAGEISIHIAARANGSQEEESFSKIVIKLINNSVKVDATTTGGLRALDIAVAQGLPRMTTTLLTHNPKIYEEVSNGQTIFHFAASNGNISILRALFQGYIISNQDAEINKALEKLPTDFKGDHVDYILNLKLDSVKKILNKKGNLGQTLLSIAVNKQYFELARWLIERGADPNVRDDELNSVWHLVAKTTAGEFANYLLDLRLDCTSPNKKGETPMAIAKNIPDSVVYKLLLNYQTSQLKATKTDYVKRHFIYSKPQAGSSSVSQQSSNETVFQPH